MRKLRTTSLLVAGLLAGGAGAGHAAEEGIKDVNWPEDGFFGAFDPAALQRGLQIYQNVCHNCHSLKYLAFRNLAALGYNEDQVKAIAAQFTVQDGPNDQGEMFSRPARPSDHMPSPFKNEQEARASNGGALPPDLSLIIKAREGGESYVYSVLTGFAEAPPGVKVPDGQYYNTAFPGHFIAMPPPLQDNTVTYEDKTPATLSQEAHDIAEFLTWVAEPSLEARKQTGIKAILFLVVMAGLFMAYKRRVWADIH
jgi:ubiquinol-cytochrome c reductase cytochrome c1 subunit